MKHVIICGGRYFVPPAGYDNRLRAWLAKQEPIGAVHHGGARGADRWAGGVAQTSGYIVRVHEADWDKHGTRAGPIRNNEMLLAALEGSVPDLPVVLAFPGGRGTSHMKAIAKAAGCKVVEVE